MKEFILFIFNKIGKHPERSRKRSCASKKKVYFVDNQSIKNPSTRATIRNFFTQLQHCLSRKKNTYACPFNNELYRNFTKNYDQNTTYLPTKICWPEVNKNPKSWPYLIVERPFTPPREASFSELLLKQLRISNLPMKGHLMTTPEGLIYVKIAEYIVEAGQKHVGLQEYFPFFGLGAHIAVIHPYERHCTGDLLGEEFYFFIDSVLTQCVIEPFSRENVWFLSIQSPQLEKIRRKNGLSSTPFQKGLSILFAIKQCDPSVQMSANDACYFRINPAVQPA